MAELIKVDKLVSFVVFQIHQNQSILNLFLINVWYSSI